MTIGPRPGVSRVTILTLFLWAALAHTSAGSALAGPFRDGRLFLTTQSFSGSGSTSDEQLGWEPTCEKAESSASLPSDALLISVVASFPRPTPPHLSWVSFGVDYDPMKLEVLPRLFSADSILTVGTWPEPGSGIRMEWDRDRERSSVEIGRFTVRPLTDDPVEFRLIPGPLGGQFGDFIFHETIDGYGSFGFGQPGDLECPIEENCCLVSGVCALRTEYWCDWYDGIFVGAESCTACDDVGACCSNWHCKLTVESDCNGEQNDWKGGGTTCSPNDCIPFGACCLEDGECILLDESRCNGRAGWLMEGEACDPNPCSKLGACCHYSMSQECQLTTAAACDSIGVLFSGDGSICEPDLCPPGICCLDTTEECQYTDEAECSSLEGSFLRGPWGPLPEACDYACCCGPVEESSWGAIKRRFLDETQGQSP